MSKTKSKTGDSRWFTGAHGSAPDPLKPTLSLLTKLGSLVVHMEEIMSPTGHVFDRAAIEQLLNDTEVKFWLARMDDLALLPVKR